MKTFRLSIILIAGGALLWFTYAALRARGNLVTLNVRNADLRDVVKKIEWQTWEQIFVQKEVQGKVTLNVRKAPLEEVLGILGEQTSSRWTTLFPLFSSGKSLGAFKKSARGEVAPAENGWSNLVARPFMGFGGMFGDNARNQNNLVSLHLEDKDLSFASIALSRFSQAQIVPEDGTAGVVNLKLNQATLAQAVAQLARQTRRNWKQFYALQTWRGGDRARRGPEGPSGPPGQSDRPGPPARPPGTNDGARPEPTPEMRAAFEKQMEAQMAAMTPEERKQAQEMRQRMEEMRQLTPEQRQQRMREWISSPEAQQRIQSRMLSGIKNTTPEQRAERDKQRLEAQRRGQQR